MQANNESEKQNVIDAMWKNHRTNIRFTMFYYDGNERIIYETLCNHLVDIFGFFHE